MQSNVLTVITFIRHELYIQCAQPDHYSFATWLNYFAHSTQSITVVLDCVIQRTSYNYHIHSTWFSYSVYSTQSLQLCYMIELLRAPIYCTTIVLQAWLLQKLYTLSLICDYCAIKRTQHNYSRHAIWWNYHINR